MEERIITFRADAETERKLRMLAKLEQEKLSDEESKAKARSDLIRDAVNYYYQYCLAGDSNDYYVYRITLAIRDVLRQVYPDLMRSLNTLQYRSMVMHRLIRLICSAIEFNGSEEDWMKAMETDTRFELCAQKLVTDELRNMEEEDEYERNGNGNNSDTR